MAKHFFCSVCGVKSFYVPRSHPDGYSVNARCLDDGTVETLTIAQMWPERIPQLAESADAHVTSLPWFADRFAKGADWRALAYWIHNHLPYGELQFFPKLAAFNISWHQRPKRNIHSFIEPKGLLVQGEPPNAAFAEFYSGFPEFRNGPAA